MSARQHPVDVHGILILIILLQPLLFIKRTGSVFFFQDFKIALLTRGDYYNHLGQVIANLCGTIERGLEFQRQHLSMEDVLQSILTQIRLFQSFLSYGIKLI